MFYLINIILYNCKSNKSTVLQNFNNQQSTIKQRSVVGQARQLGITHILIPMDLPYNLLEIILFLNLDWLIACFYDYDKNLVDISQSKLEIINSNHQTQKKLFVTLELLRYHWCKNSSYFFVQMLSRNWEMKCRDLAHT